MNQIKIAVTHVDYNNVPTKNIFYINDWYNFSSDMTNRGIDLLRVEKIEVIRGVKDSDIIDETLGQ